MMRPVALCLGLLAITACGSSAPVEQGVSFSPYGSYQPEAPSASPAAGFVAKRNGWTIVEGPVRNDVGVLAGRFTVYSQGNFLKARLNGPGSSKGVLILGRKMAEAFRAGMPARTGCRGDWRTEFNTVGGGVIAMSMIPTCA